MCRRRVNGAGADGGVTAGWAAGGGAGRRAGARAPWRPRPRCARRRGPSAPRRRRRGSPHAGRGRRGRSGARRQRRRGGETGDDGGHAGFLRWTSAGAVGAHGEEVWTRASSGARRQRSSSRRVQMARKGVMSTPTSRRAAPGDHPGGAHAVRVDRSRRRSGRDRHDGATRATRWSAPRSRTGRYASPTPRRHHRVSEIGRLPQ